MAARLYVGNLPYTATEEQLEELFGQVGTVVSVSLPIDRVSGRPRGFGFVEMESSTEAEEAVRKFDGYMLENRAMRVDMAREREERGTGFRPGGRREGYGGGGAGGGRQGRDRPYGGRGRGFAA